MPRKTNARRPHGNGSRMLWILVLGFLAVMFASPDARKAVGGFFPAPPAKSQSEQPLAPIDPKYLPTEAPPAEGAHFSRNSADYVRVMSGEDLGGLRVVDVWDYMPEHKPVRITWDLSVTRGSLTANSLEDASFTTEVHESADATGRPGYNLIIRSSDGYEYPISLIGDWVSVDGVQHIAIRQVFAVYGGFRFPH